ncbi:MAG: hypothetical protein LBG13_00630, partial [Holosporales bacterium]|nr:hypothetical protein [Holosporales bacterium]
DLGGNFTVMAANKKFQIIKGGGGIIRAIVRSKGSKNCVKGIWILNHRRKQFGTGARAGVCN